MPLGLDAADEVDLLGDVLGGATPDDRFLNVQAGQILTEGLRVVFGDFPGGLAGAAEPFSILSSPLSASETGGPHRCCS